MASKESGGILKVVGSVAAVGLVSAFFWWQGSKDKLQGKGNDKKGKRAVFAPTREPSTTFEADSILKELFRESAKVANSLKTITNGDKLMLYGLYKQATVGDCPEQAPSPFNIVAHAKHASWCKFMGMKQKDAMIYYMQAVQQLRKGDNLTGDEGDEGGNFGGMGLKPSRPAREEEESNNIPADVDSLEAKLRRVASTDDLNAIRDCVKKGADVDAADENGQTALHFCADRGFKAGVSYLLEQNADPNATDLDGISVLQAAVISDHVEVCKLLLSKGANPDLEDTDGDTPRSCALEDGSENMKALFTAHSKQKAAK